MSKAAVTGTLAALALALAVPAGAADYAATDDTGKYLGAAAAPYFTAMRGVGLTVNVMTLTYEPGRRPESAELQLMNKALPLAKRAGVKVVFRVFPARPTTLGADAASATRFAAWTARLARRYPQVREFVVGNEPNQPRFWQPQYDGRGKQLSAPAFGRVLAATYDALKRVDPGITVIGLGLSSRGNDRPGARDNVSTSPVRFVAALGRWYRASGRTRPLMDALSFHPYPNSSTDLHTRRFEWPNAGLADLGRVKLALWDAFSGTAQPTPADGLRIMLGEIGWQVDTSGNGAYTGVEAVAVTSEQRQAAVYGDIVRRLACDASVSRAGFFAFFDQREREGMQSGLFRADGTPRPSADAVRAAIAAGCAGVPRSWVPPPGVVGGKAFFSAWKRHCYGVQGSNRACVTAAEDARFRVGIFPAGTPRAQMARRLARAAEVSGRLPAYARLPVRLEPPPSGEWVVAVRIVAEANAARSTLVVGPRFTT